MWKVLAEFADLTDGGHVYHVGDTYPYKGIAAKERVLELSGRNNRLGVPLIEEYEPEAEEKPRKRSNKE